MHTTICCIFNYPPHYRKAIYELMDAELKCHFYFGNKVPGTLEEMDVKNLKGFQKRFKNYLFKKRIIWQKDKISLLFKPYKYYILSVDTACINSWFFIFMAKLLGKKIYFWTHGSYGKESNFQRIKNSLYFWPSSGLLLYGNYARRVLINRGYQKEKMFIIANSLDYKLNIEIREQLVKTKIYTDYFNNNNPTLIFIGRLEKKKKLDILLKAIYHLKNEESIDVNCILVGDGREKDILEKITHKLDLKENVLFFGASYDEYEIGNLIYNADICISPGNVGLTGIHSLSYGTPVITHSNYSKQMPEFEAIIPKLNGLFFRENDIISLSNSIKKWLKTYPTKNEILIKNCYQVIDEIYNPYYQVNVLKKVFKKGS